MQVVHFSRLRSLLAATALLLATSSAAGAQAFPDAWGDNGYFSVNGLYEVSTRESRVAGTQEINSETATITATQETGRRPLFDVTAGGRLAGTLGIGFGVTYGRTNEDARIGGSIPHPFYFDEPRRLDGAAPLERTDLMLHIAAMWLLPMTPRLQATVFGGPTWFQLRQEVITAVTVAESYPFDRVVLDTVTRDRRTVSRWGYHAGLDLSYFFSRTVGIQGMLRYSAATATIDNAGVLSDVRLGGTHAGVGLRIRY